MNIHKLHPKFVRDVTKAGEYHDGDGLYLKVRKSGTKQWLYRYMLHGCTHRMGLGSADAIGLAEARADHKLRRQQVKRGIDPIEARKQKRKKSTTQRQQR